MYQKYLNAVQDERMKRPRWRTGQCYFNVLFAFFPEIADSVRGGPLDPFHRDAVIPSFLKFIEEELNKKAN